MLNYLYPKFELDGEFKNINQVVKLVVARQKVCYLKPGSGLSGVWLH